MKVQKAFAEHPIFTRKYTRAVGNRRSSTDLKKHVIFTNKENIRDIMINIIARIQRAEKKM